MDYVIDYVMDCGNMIIDYGGTVIDYGYAIIFFGKVRMSIIDYGNRLWVAIIDYWMSIIDYKEIRTVFNLFNLI